MRMLAELKDQMRQQSMQLTESNSEIRKQMGNLIESQNGQSKEMEKLIESQNGQSKELEKLTASINNYLRKQLEVDTNITGHAESDAPRYCLLGTIIPFFFQGSTNSDLAKLLLEFVTNIYQKWIQSFISFLSVISLHKLVLPSFADHK